MSSHEMETLTERVNSEKRPLQGLRKSIAITLVTTLACLAACRSKAEIENFNNSRHTIKSYFEGIDPQKTAWAKYGGVAVLTDLDNDGSFDLEEFYEPNFSLNENKIPVSTIIKKGYEGYVTSNPENIERIKKLKERGIYPEVFVSKDKSYFENLRIN